MNRMEVAEIAKGAVAGLVGGLIASYVMSEFQTIVTKIGENMSENGKQKEKKSSEPATTRAAEMISEDVFDHRLTKKEKEIADPLMHYAMGGTSGLIYGVASEFVPATTAGVGLPFGTAVWLIADDVVVPALGLSKPVTEYPASTHAYALSSHLVYGLTTELVRRAVRNIL